MEAMMHGYATWAQYLDRFARGDNTALHDLSSREFCWQIAFAEQLTVRVHETLAARLEELQRRLERDLQHLLGGNHGELNYIGQELTWSKRNLAPLVCFTQLPAFPEGLRSVLQSDLRRFVSEMQDSLEGSVRSNRSQHSFLYAEIRTHRLTSALELLDVPPRPPSSPDSGVTLGDQVESASGRRPIL